MGKTREYTHRSIDVWDEELQPIVEGVVTTIEPFKVDDEERDTLVIETPEGFLRIWHSGALKEAFELAVVGNGIRLVYKGRKAIGGNKTFKRISVAVWKKGDLKEITEAYEARQKAEGRKESEA